MQILEVDGDDFAAVTFEDELKGDVTKYADLCYDNNGKYEEDGIEFELHEFGKVDPKFIEFVDGFQDYDDSKSHNFYVVPKD